MNKTAIWFSRHAPSEAQLSEIAAMGLTLVAVENGQRLGAMAINNDGDLNAVMTAVLAMASEHNATACFGVFPAPVQECLHRTAQDAVQRGDWAGELTCYAAWNVQRSVEGGKPTFAHQRFCCVGGLSDAAMRWVRRSQ